MTAVLLGLSGAGLVYIVMAAGHLVGAILVATAPVRDVTEESSGDRWRVVDALDGYRELRREPGARLLVGLASAALVVVGAIDILAVVLAIDVLGLGPSGPGVLASASGIGTLIGAAASVSLIGRRRLAPAIGVGLLITGLPLALVGFAGAPILAFVLLAICGAGWSLFDVASRTLLQRIVRDDVLARVFGLQEGLMMIALAIGSAVVPPLVAWLGPRGAFVAAGMFLPALGLLGWHRLMTTDAVAVEPGPELALLLSIPIFAPLRPAVLERLSRNLVTASAQPGEIVIREGDPGDLFYIVVEGRADVIAQGRPIATLDAGDYFGEIALLRDVPRTATVTARSRLDLRTLERAEFLEAVTGSRWASRVAHERASRRLGEVEGPAPD